VSGDISRGNGPGTVLLEAEAAELYHWHCGGRLLRLRKELFAQIGNILLDERGEAAGLVIFKSRGAKLDTLEGPWNGEWKVTKWKFENIYKVAANWMMLEVFAMVYLTDDDPRILLKQSLYDPVRPLRNWPKKRELPDDPTHGTVNSTQVDAKRTNLHFDMSRAEVIRRFPAPPLTKRNLGVPNGY
jgi:hypothetical protein